MDLRAVAAAEQASKKAQLLRLGRQCHGNGMGAVEHGLLSFATAKRQKDAQASNNAKMSLQLRPRAQAAAGVAARVLGGQCMFSSAARTAASVAAAMAATPT